MNVYRRLRISIATIFAALILAVVAIGLIVYFGLYNVTATKEHPAVLYSFLHTVMRKSVAARADGIRAPDLGQPERIRDGFVLYREHCVQCHGAPGIAPQPFAFGLRPLPPSLLLPAKDWPASHIYWVVKHGVRMTAMPAWEYRLGEREMWDLTAFVKYLPAMSPVDYRDWDRQIRASRDPSAPPEALRPGNAQAGRRAVDEYLCATCHQIPGVAGGNPTVGPPLAGIATRAYIAGSLQNSRDNMLRWLRDPQRIKPDTGMPNLHMREQDARDIAAFLYTLDQER
jgi:mono/diheme cytochrome c family protein